MINVTYFGVATSENEIQKEELMHYGVLGMKWGIRKDPERSPRTPSKRYSIPEKKSAHRVRLEAKYLKKGFSNDRAEQMAARQIRAEKFIVAAAGTAVLAGAGYTAQREIGKRFVGVTLESGREMHYINALGEGADYNRRLYTTFNKADTAKYKGLLATTLRQNTPGKETTIYDTVLKATETIKAPSHKQAEKLYAEFIKTNSLKNFTSPPTYKLFNKDLVNGGADAQTFYNFMKQKGYNALLDSNDQFLSGYNTKQPLILFNAASSTVKAGESIVSKQLSDRLNKVQMGSIIAKELAPSMAMGAAILGGSAAVDTSTRAGTVNEYFKKNPNSAYSPGEVYNAIKQNSDGLTYRVDTKKLKGA